MATRRTRTRPICVTLSVIGLGATQTLALAGSTTAATTKRTTTKKVRSTTGKSTSTTRAVGTPKSTPPNILVVVADDLGVDSSPCYPAFGSVKPSMPTLEQLCREGVVFDNMTAAPVCTPSRAAMLTGKYGFRTKVLAVDDELAATESTAFDVLAAAPMPYTNAVIGKWHLGGQRSSPTHPQQLGVQYFDGFLRGQVQDYKSWPRVTQGALTTSSVYTTTAFTDSALAWTAQQRTPWFLWLAHNAPHTPFHVPPATLVARDSLNVGPSDISANPAPYYRASLEALDTEFGRLLAGLSPSVRANTVVMFMGDNGTPARVVQTPFTPQTAKGSIAQGGVHVPLIVAGAGVTEKGKRSPVLVNSVDVFSTVTQLAGATPSNQVDGRSFSGQFTNVAAPGARAVAYAELTNMWSVRNDRYKLVHNTGTGEERLYDLLTDPGETRALLIDSQEADGAWTRALTELRLAGTQIRK